MMAGRKPNPRRESEGDTRKIGARKLAAQLAAVPNATHGLPPCPEHLDGLEREVWDFWAAELADMNLDRRPDAMMLEGACVFYARAVAADGIVKREGMTIDVSTVDKESGEVVLIGRKDNPAVMISERSWKQARAFCSEFGLSPVSRTRLAVEKKDQGPSLADLLHAPRPLKPAVQ